jgi:hypothetical protein
MRFYESVLVNAIVVSNQLPMSRQLLRGNRVRRLRICGIRWRALDARGQQLVAHA